MSSIARLTLDAVSATTGWLAGWANPQTGRGDPTRDKRINVVWQSGVSLDENTLEALYNFNDLAYTIVTALPEWGLRHGWDLALISPVGADAQASLQAKEIVRAVRFKLDSLHASQEQLYAATWGQLYGGGFCFIGAADGRKSDKPIDLDNLQRIEFLRNVSRADVVIESRYQNREHPKWGQPETYRLQEQGMGVASFPVIVHESRMVRYPGAVTPQRVQNRNRGWDLSVLDRVIAKLALHDSLWDNTGAMVEDGSQGVWKIKGLFNTVVSGMRSELEARFALAEQTRSTFRSLLIDADGEDFQYVHRQFAGLDGLLAQSAIRTAAAAQMPVTVLFGQSPAGMNATGESDIRLWYDRIESYQSRVLLPGIEYIVELIFRSQEGPTSGIEPEGWQINFRSVRKATPMEEAELRARQAQIDTAYIEHDVMTPEEAAVSRFTSEGWSAETQIDLDARRVAMKAQKDGETTKDKLAAATSAADIIARVGKGEIAREAAIELIMLAFPGVKRPFAEKLVGPEKEPELPALAMPKLGEPPGGPKPPPAVPNTP